MAVSAATTTTNPAASTSAVANKESRDDLEKTRSSFLTMLTSQLQNQDPLSPMDGTAFTDQLIGFSTVEQLINQSEKMDQMIALSSANQMQSMLSYIGMEVEVQGSGFPYTGDKVDLAYEVPDGAQRVTLSVVDENQQTVWVGSGSVSQGKNWTSWDGKSTSGAPLPEGEYYFVTNAYGANDEPLETKSYVTAEITGVESVDGEPKLVIGNSYVDLSTILAVRKPGTGPVQTPPETTDPAVAA